MPLAEDLEAIQSLFTRSNLYRFSMSIREGLSDVLPHVWSGAQAPSRLVVDCLSNVEFTYLLSILPELETLNELEMGIGRLDTDTEAAQDEPVVHPSLSGVIELPTLHRLDITIIQCSHPSMEVRSSSIALRYSKRD